MLRPHAAAAVAPAGGGGAVGAHVADVDRLVQYDGVGEGVAQDLPAPLHVAAVDRYREVIVVVFVHVVVVWLTPPPNFLLCDILCFGGYVQKYLEKLTPLSIRRKNNIRVEERSDFSDPFFGKNSDFASCCRPCLSRKKIRVDAAQTSDLKDRTPPVW